MVPPLLKWIGNKQRVAEQIISVMPSEFENYYEPFLGSGAVLASLIDTSRSNFFGPKFKNAYGSDILPFLIELFEIVKTSPSTLIEYYKKEISAYYSSPDDKYIEIRDRFNKSRSPLDFCLLSRTCYSGVIRFRKSDGYMSTPRGPHSPIKPDSFYDRVMIWNSLLKDVTLSCESYEVAMSRAKDGDVVYCDPPYTHSQSIIYGAQEFSIEHLFNIIAECKERGVRVLLSINGMRDNGTKDISITPPPNLFERRIIVSCGTSMIDRLQNTGRVMENKKVDDQLLLTW